MCTCARLPVKTLNSPNEKILASRLFILLERKDIRLPGFSSGSYFVSISSGGSRRKVWLWLAMRS